MKTLLSFIVCIFLAFNVAIGQNKQKSEVLQFSIIKKSDEPLSNTEHFYELIIHNKSSKAIDYTITTTDFSCHNNFSKLNNELVSLKNQKLESLRISPYQYFSFKIKLTRNHLTKLNSWYCFDINAVDKQGKVISNTLQLSQFIPDPRNFN